jgi:hypothetical protein
MEARFYALTIVLVLTVFAPAAMTCYARDISIHNFYKIENSRMVLQRRIPDGDSPYYRRRGDTAATRVSPPVAAREKGQGLPPKSPPVASRSEGQGLPPNSPPGVIH